MKRKLVFVLILLCCLFSGMITSAHAATIVKEDLANVPAGKKAKIVITSATNN